MASPEPVLRLADIRASYGERLALDGLNFELRRGEILAVLGHNGAGKTTALRVAVGLKRPKSGTVSLDGRDIGSMSCSQRARAGLSLVPEGVSGIFPTLTVRQNMAAARPSGQGGTAERDDIERLITPVFGEVLVHRADQIAGSMSGGQRQMLALSLALIRRPSVLLLDEPSTGLAPSVVSRIFGVLAELSEVTGTAILVVEQDVAAAIRIATRIVILQSGSVVTEFSRENCPPAAELWRFF